MQKLVRPGLLAAVLVVLVAGTFIGLTAAHDGGGDQVQDTCEMDRADEECEMSHGEEDCPMMDSGMMGTGDDCPMENRGGTMGTHGDSTDSRGNCPMN